MSDDVVTYDFDELIHETEMAWLMQLHLDDPVWLPKSQVTVHWGDRTVEVPLWLAEEKGLE